MLVQTIQELSPKRCVYQYTLRFWGKTHSALTVRPIHGNMNSEVPAEVKGKSPPIFCGQLAPGKLRGDKETREWFENGVFQETSTLYYPLARKFPECPNQNSATLPANFLFIHWVKESGDKQTFTLIPGKQLNMSTILRGGNQKSQKFVRWSIPPQNANAPTSTAPAPCSIAGMSDFRPGTKQWDKKFAPPPYVLRNFWVQFCQKC